jgi:hypothetical protein
MAADLDHESVLGKGFEVPEHSGTEAGVSPRTVVFGRSVVASGSARSMVRGAVRFDPPAIEGEQIRTAGQLWDLCRYPLLLAPAEGVDEGRGMEEELG